MHPSSGNTPGILAPPPLLYLTGFLAGYLLDRQFPMPLPGSPLNTVFVLPILSISALILAWALLTMHRARTPVSPYKPARALVTDGPYRYSRNPLYLALTGLYVAAGFLVDSVWPIILLAVLIPAMHRGVILREERHLCARFGERYLRYARTVRRWL